MIILAIAVSRDVTLYVGFEPRATGLPSWLSDWAATGERVYVATFQQVS